MRLRKVGLWGAHTGKKVVAFPSTWSVSVVHLYMYYIDTRTLSGLTPVVTGHQKVLKFFPHWPLLASYHLQDCIDEQIFEGPPFLEGIESWNISSWDSSGISHKHTANGGPESEKSRL